MKKVHLIEYAITKYAYKVSRAIR